ncbi:carbohydrate ABC transporter permease [Cohnella fermenti]|uniref:Carbohydrate ABC transporter permease n=1 Tax=Cohnella fermenti TaxID=2565925 RepID=A0A4S4BF38_9BACL|nr:carbohydrate ABC transporter permease [Cohnella fermenti]THF72632.1 carbohydrate ABC transporter permease [Cohnella fermenti]
MKLTRGERIFEAANAALLTLVSLTMLYPLLYVLGLSLSAQDEVAAPRLLLMPLHPTLSSYAKIFAHPQLFDAYLMTIERTVLGLAAVLLLTSLTAYPLSRKTFPDRSFIMKLFVFSMLFNGGIIPTYLLIKNLGMLDTIWALVLPGAVTAFNLVVIRNFFESIPGEIMESARMDGAGEWRIFFRIVLPLSRPVLAVIALWTGVSHWNAWFDAMIYMQDTKHQVLQLFLRRTVIEASLSLTPGEEMNMARVTYTPETLKAATVMVVSAPILLIYPFVQRFFVKGILLGSVKG